jgi:hypothetical protein
VAVLVAAGLLIRTFQSEQAIDLGFDRRDVVVAHVDFDRSGYDELRIGAFVSELIARLERQPDVGSVVTPGAAIGLLAAGSGARLLESRIYGITPWDPASFGAAALLLALAALGPAHFPARRADAERSGALTPRRGRAVRRLAAPRGYGVRARTSRW